MWEILTQLVLLNMLFRLFGFSLFSKILPKLSKFSKLSLFCCISSTRMLPSNDASTDPAMIVWAPIKTTNGHPYQTDIKPPVYSPCGQYALYVTDSHQSPNNTATICVIDLNTGTIHTYGELTMENTNAWKYYWLNNGEVIIICAGDADDDFAHKCPLVQYLYSINHYDQMAEVIDEFECTPSFNHIHYPNALMHNNISQLMIRNNGLFGYPTGEMIGLTHFDSKCRGLPFPFGKCLVERTREDQFIISINSAFTVVSVCGEFLLMPYDFRVFANDFKPIRIKCLVKEIDEYKIDLPFMVDGGNSYSPAFFCCGSRIYLPVYKEKGTNKVGLPVREWYFNRFAYLDLANLDQASDRTVINEDSQDVGLIELGQNDPTDNFVTTSRVKFWQDHRYVMYTEIPGTSDCSLLQSTDLEDTATSYIVDLNTARVDKVEGIRKGYSISSLFKGHMLVMNSVRTLGDNMNCRNDRVNYEFKYIS